MTRPLEDSLLDTARREYVVAEMGKRGAWKRSFSERSNRDAIAKADRLLSRLRELLGEEES